MSRKPNVQLSDSTEHNMNDESGGQHGNSTYQTDDFELSVPLLPGNGTAQHDSLHRFKGAVYESEIDCNRPEISNNSGSVGPEASQPEKEPLQFKINLKGASPDVEQLVNNIKHVAEQFLYHWKTFPINLPTPISQCSTNPTSQVFVDDSAGRSTAKRDLFIAPSFDELEDVAFDEKGNQKKLTANQLKSIRKTGEFDVDSLNFSGQQHRWKLSQLLQKGTENSRNALLDDLAGTLRLIVVTGKDRLFSNYFSVKQAIKALLVGSFRILDTLVGMPSLEVHNSDAKFNEERNQYLVAELVCRVDDKDSLEMLCSYIKSKLDGTEECERRATFPYRFLTPSGIELDLRLWDRSLMNKALPILTTILKRETMGWFPHFKEKIISELNEAKNMSDEDIVAEVNEAALTEYFKRVYSSILSDRDINRLGNGIAQLLVQQAQSVVLMQRAVDSVQSRLNTTQEAYTNMLKKTHPILSRIDKWLMSKLKSSEKKFSKENQWSVYEEAIALCNSQGLYQAAYFLNRDLSFKRECKPALLLDLKKAKTASHTFFWHTKIWLPKNWIIRRSFQGQSERVPTVLSKHEPSFTTQSYDPSRPVFLVEKEKVRTTTTRWPLWRICNYFHRTWCWTWNAMFFFGIVVPWRSPISLRALFLPKPFMPDFELSQVNGTLFPRKHSLTPTFISRLLSLWRQIFESRAQFELQPDTGFIGKSFARHIHRLWCYILKGPFGTIGLVVVFPVISLSIVFVSLCIALTSIIWMPPLTLVVQITNGLIYDLDSFERNRYFVIFEVLLWKIGFQGCCQLLAAIFTAFISPLAAIFFFTGGVARYCFRIIWDATIFHFIIKTRGRIPASDSFIAKRISGPGLASQYFFQISPEQALAVFESKMEWDELKGYETVVKNTIEQPQKEFRRFIEVCFGSFSAQLANNGPYKNLMEEARNLLTVLQGKLQARRKFLEPRLSVTYKSKIKVTPLELKIVIQQGAIMLEKFYPNHIFPKLACSEDEFWESKSLQFRDWTELARLLYSELFSSEFLIALDHITDAYCKLQPHPHVDLTRYTEMIQNARLDAGVTDENVYSSINIKIHSPYLNVLCFNPRENNLESKIMPHDVFRNSRTTLSITWKIFCSLSKLEIPLPVPHPAQIAVTIYNRDSDDPIPLKSIRCQSLLRSIEDHQ